MKTGVVIVAAGRGERLGYDLRKAMVPLGDRPLLVHAVDRFAEARDLVAEIVLVVHDDDREPLTRGTWSAHLAAQGVTHLVEGGARRQDSVLNGLRALSRDCEAALVHDAARPFCSPGVVRRLVASLASSAGSIPTVPVTSTVKRITCDEIVAGTVDRRELRLAQTPQAARREILVEALERAEREGRDVTDEAQALESAGHKVAVVEDSPWNFKITTPDDLRLAELVLERRLWEPQR
ncbi:MAG: 2-C-methyl-D-erythritol 4-phosphate cytidylyltransferase [Planctomycetota bacterium]